MADEADGHLNVQFTGAVFFVDIDWEFDLRGGEEGSVSGCCLQHCIPVMATFPGFCLYSQSDEAYSEAVWLERKRNDLLVLSNFSW